MEYEFEDAAPEVDDDAFVSETAYLAGQVTVDEGASLWPFVCLRGDTGPVSVGSETNVQEFTMLHGADVGDKVSVGHGAVVDFATIEDHSLIGMGSSVMGGARVESDCIVAANAVVLQDQTIPEGHMAYGVPAETTPLTDEQLAGISQTREHYSELGQRFRRVEATDT